MSSATATNYNCLNISVNLRHGKQVSLEATLEHCQWLWCLGMGRQVVPHSWTSNRKSLVSSL